MADKEATRILGMPVRSIMEVGGLIAMVLAGIAYFETSTSASKSHQDIRTEMQREISIAAEDREIGDIRTRLKLNQMAIDRYQEIAKVRALAEDELIDLRALEAERDLLLQRMTELGEA